MPINENDYVGFGIDPATGRRHAIKHLPAMAEWEPGVYQVEQGDKIIGGVDGIHNLPIQQLANRTEYLKQQIDQGGGNVPGIRIVDVTLPVTDWAPDGADTTGYPYFLDIADSVLEGVESGTVIPARESLDVVAGAGICPTIDILSGKIRVYSARVPAADISGTAVIFSTGGGAMGVASREQVDNALDTLFPTP